MTLMMIAVLTPISVATLMTAEKQSFFIYKLFFKNLLTNAAGCGIIERGFNGPGTTVEARISDLIPPYANFLLLLATFHMRLIFP